MDDARTFMQETEPAVQGLFKLLNEYGWHKMKSLVGLVNSKVRLEQEQYRRELSSRDVAREVIAGSILQIAYAGIATYAHPACKPPGALRFEAEINTLIRENPKQARHKGEFCLPAEFCVGRAIGDLPLGMVVFAGRNQYNHFHEGRRLRVVNELVFNYLHQIWPSPPNGLSFDLQPGRPFAYSVLAALGWLDTQERLGYAAYHQDMTVMLLR